MESTVRELLNVKGWGAHGVPATETVYDAITKMVDLDIGALVVTDPYGFLDGIVTERDYLKKVALRGRSSRTTMVGEIMTAELVCVGLESTIRQCMVIMSHHRCRHLPVMDDGIVVGMVSIGDCARRIAVDSDFSSQVLRDFITGRYPA